ncbi:hypothetical protein PVAP13_2NG585900 [Panicum virgatum]|uniref:Uncharacterized protein n=1 Tax=Panicum virgatum TaxID=38727 RepID=A0A8T0W4A5_PANVG|nr:hypothetical protein PVAP13_2NG585900 [Panicum virgatum]
MDGSCSRGGTEMALQQLQPLLPWLDQAVKAAAADGGSAAAKAKAKTGKKRRPAARAGIAARGVKALLSGVVEVVGKRFERSVPAAKFGHVAYIR